MRIIFILPGLFDPAPETERYNLRCLRYLLARSDREASAKADGRLLFLSSIIPHGETITGSRLSYWSDFLRAPEGHCYYCEPVHLRADLSDAIVFDSSHFGLTRAEAQSLVDTISQYLEEGSCKVELANPQRWYLLSKNEIAWEMPTLRQMQRRPVGAVLTDSALSPEWRHLMNELQIVLHQHQINAEREERGELPVNGVWIHEGDSIKAPPYAVRRVVTKSSDAHRACRELALECAEELKEPSGKEGDILIFDESLRPDMETRGASLQSMETRWFKPVYSWLRQGDVREIIIDSADGQRFVVRRNFLNRFWKRMKPLAAYAKQNS